MTYLNPRPPKLQNRWCTNFTIAHELGHNLGLLHGGFESCNYKPNYNSVMNYDFQFDGVDVDCDGIPEGSFSDPELGVGDYSVGANVDIDENLFDENLGVCGTQAVDLDGNGVIQANVTANLNPEIGNACTQDFTLLGDFNDWVNIEPEVIRQFGPHFNGGAPPIFIVDCQENPFP